MKQLASFLLGIALLLSCPPARAGGARLTISGSNAPFPLTSVQVTVRLLADVAETELEIAFSNPGGIQREAEFILPLPKDEYRYELPLDFGVAPDSFQCSISFPKDQRPGFAADTGWSFGRHGSSGLTAALEKQAPPATSPSATAVGTS